MKYQGTANFEHNSKAKIGVLITNLGTPEAPTKSGLRKYLKQFLSDPRVVEVPRLLWWFILNGVILNIRPSRSAKAYQGVWTEQGSPLMVHTQNQHAALKKQLTKEFGEQILVEFAMRYGQPAISDVIESMQQQGVTKLVVLPLYPQYSAATSASTFDAISDDFKQRRWLPDFRFISHYHDDLNYIKALANKIKQHWQINGQAEKLVFSYHGVPQKYLDKGDPYHCECYKTSRLVAEQLGLNKDQYITAFQSRFGREEWIKPYTDASLKSFAQQGIKFVQVVCPGFSADCLETIEEIGEENRDYFLEAGGEKFEYIPALNSDAEHIDALAEIIKSNIQGWQVTQDLALTLEQAKSYGATE
ncbi:ferrochelatase [Catenovulum maritimum]|uniref:Ferrochelatase n=1 Tax=Catenovulum maritimum TaxID=1513271 RepID=A0A0J8GTN6_9ALTE|nr:ferrochelatase [Catenovulum maritimum]KMT66102.1 ferrochelatase [Catenovulum maritimum]